MLAVARNSICVGFALAMAVTVPALAEGTKAAPAAGATVPAEERGVGAGNMPAAAHGVATHLPKRLSVLAGTDVAAWQSARSIRAVNWRRPKHPLELPAAKQAATRTLQTAR